MAVSQSGSQIDHAFGSISVSRHVGDFVFDNFELGDGLPKLLAIFGIVRSHLRQQFAAADIAGGKPQAANVERFHRHLETLAERAEQIFHRHLHVVEIKRGGVGTADAEFVFRFACRTTRPFRFHQKCRNLFFDHAVLDHIGLGKNRPQIADAAVADPHFAAIEDEMCFFIIQHSFTLNTGGIRACARLGERKSGNPLAAGQFWQVFLLLLFGAVQQQAVGTDAGMGTQRHRQRGIVVADLFEHAAVGCFGETGTAILFRNRQAEEAELSHALQDFFGDFLIAVDLWAVDSIFSKFIPCLQDHIEIFLLILRQFRIRKNRFLIDYTSKQRLHKTDVGFVFLCHGFCFLLKF